MAQEYAGTELKLGGNESLRIMDDMFTVEVSMQLREEVNKVFENYNENIAKQGELVDEILQKYAEELNPLVLDGISETQTAYDKRVKPLLKARKEEIDAAIPDDKESSTQKLAFECLLAIAGQFGQGHKVTKDNFKKASWPKVKLALAKFMLSNECPQGKIFLPPQNLD